MSKNDDKIAKRPYETTKILVSRKAVDVIMNASFGYETVDVTLDRLLGVVHKEWGDRT